MSLCICDPTIEFDLSCFLHGNTNRLRLENESLRGQLAIAKEAFKKLQKFTRPDGFIKRTIEEALAKLGDE
jgi:hypothetical protein